MRTVARWGGGSRPYRPVGAGDAMLSPVVLEKMGKRRDNRPAGRGIYLNKYVVHQLPYFRNKIVSHFF